MEKKENKKTSIIHPILWMVITAIWIVIVYKNINTKGVPGFLIGLQCCTIAASLGAAVANFIRYKRSRDDRSW